MGLEARENTTVLEKQITTPRLLDMSIERRGILKALPSIEPMQSVVVGNQRNRVLNFDCSDPLSKEKILFERLYIVTELFSPYGLLDRVNSIGSYYEVSGEDEAYDTQAIVSNVTVGVLRNTFKYMYNCKVDLVGSRQLRKCINSMDNILNNQNSLELIAFYDYINDLAKEVVIRSIEQLSTISKIFFESEEEMLQGSKGKILKGVRGLFLLDIRRQKNLRAKWLDIKSNEEGLHNMVNGLNLLFQGLAYSEVNNQGMPFVMGNLSRRSGVIREILLDKYSKFSTN
jgi:hypothetical protein